MEDQNLKTLPNGKSTREIIQNLPLSMVNLLNRVIEAPKRIMVVSEGPDAPLIGKLHGLGLVRKMGREGLRFRWQLDKDKFSIDDRTLVREILGIYPL